MFKSFFIPRLIEHLRNPLYFNGYFLTLSSVTTSLLGFAYWVFAARFYSADIVGKNSSAINAMLFLSGLAGLYLDGMMMRFLPRAGKKTPRLVGSVYLISALVCLVVAIVFLLGLNIWFPALGFLRDSPWVFWSFILAVITGCIFELEDGALIGLRQSRWVPLENTLYGVAKLALLVTFAVHLPIYGIYVSWVAPVVLVILGVNWFIFRSFIPGHIQATVDVSEPVDTNHVIRFVASNYLGSLFNLAYMMLPPLIVLQLLGSEASAYFYLPWVIASSLRTLITNMGSSLTVEGSLNRAKLQNYFRGVLLNTTGLLLPAILLMVVAAPVILSLFGKEYASQGTPLLRLLALGALPSVVITLYLSFSRLQNWLNRIIAIHGAFALLSLTLIIVLVPGLGITGVGVAWLITQFSIAAVIGLFHFRSALRMLMSIVQRPNRKPLVDLYQNPQNSVKDE